MTMSNEENSTDMVPRVFINLDEFEKIKSVANYFVENKALPKGIDNAGKLVMVMQAGRDLNLSVTQSMTGLAIINGVVTVYGSVAAVLMKRAGYRWKISPMLDIFDGNNNAIDVVKKLTIRHRDEVDYSAEIEYHRSDAVKSGVTGNEVWKKYPERMMYWKLLAKARVEFCPEVLDGVPMYEDYQDLKSDESPVEDFDDLATKIRDCQTLDELKLLSGEVKVSKKKDYISLYAEKQRSLSSINVIDATNTTETAEDITSVREQNIDDGAVLNEDPLQVPGEDTGTGSDIL